ncbi:hypothetical protein [Micromonospora sagamiensis]|uniref:Uncharacterized protein n=1 Tax=Micromonospora sagamiensis TaxID=47875 RepID=A0A562WL26_9ACTN|nr:hypothetical protein [Micromonospora sagamiensis]TWJ30905.1 hypothetical protein JD81_04454 [Micromonospora sagamiensis]BCL16056.1 hypothetical protein GCM10017556_37950 [Micromonospora sagamiensis]
MLVESEVLLSVLSGLTVGFLAGLFAFKVKSRWCPRCGSYTEPVRPTDRR